MNATNDITSWQQLIGFISDNFQNVVSQIDAYKEVPHDGKYFCAMEAFASGNLGKLFGMMRHTKDKSGVPSDQLRMEVHPEKPHLFRFSE